MKKRNIAMVIILVTLVPAAAILVIVGVITHTEAGLMDDWPEWGDEFPLTYSVGRYTASGVQPDADALRAAMGAADAVNSRLGFEVFANGGAAGSAVLTRINITIGVPHEEGWMDSAGDARMRQSQEGGPWSCDIRTSNTGTVELLSLVLQHELGHCLGLDHDDFDSSIMREVQKPTPNGVFPPRITDHDRGLLRGLYMDSAR